MTLYLLENSNYYNRIVKRFETIEEYLPNLKATIDNVNFNPNDGISAEQIINYSGEIPDYVVVCDGNEIISRWYVIEASRTRAQQFKMTLYRDVIADWYEQVINAPMFVEKGWLAYDDPAIFNNEDMLFNQIKTKEHLLKDESGIPWIVGYYAKDATDIKGTVPTNQLDDLGYLQLSTSIEAWEYANYTAETPFISYFTNGQIGIKARQDDGISGAQIMLLLDSDSVRSDKSNQYSRETLRMNYQISMTNWVQAEAVNNGVSAVGWSTLRQQLPAFLPTQSQAALTDLLSYNGRLVRDINGKFYNVVVTQQASKTISNAIAAGSLFQSLAAICSASNIDGISFFLNTPDATSFVAYGEVSEYVVTLTRRQSLETSYDLTSGSKLLTTDAPYNIFAIPCGNIEVRAPFSDETLCECSADLAIACATEMQRAHQSKIFDIQLLPFCPIQELINTGDGTLIAPEGGYYTPIKHEEQIVGIIYNVPSSKFTFNIQAAGLSGAATALEAKINNECDYYRLSSPNYSNYFDFNLEKNNGVKYFNVDCEYKPFTPYLHINPNFGGLYGRDFNDARGLILGGDFSLSQVGDAWEQYKIQNKTFQETFDRQIQNMEVNNNASRVAEIVNAVTGTLQGTVAGATTGMIGGGLPGAVAGGIVGGVASAAGGIADIMLNEQLRNEAMDYTKDLFGYQLQNIRALPQTISKISSFNPNNKIFPVLEYYTCTEVEKQALRDKLTYNGMTIMRIGRLADFLTPEMHYFKGKLIRLENSEEDFHVVNTIANELNKGVFL